MPRGGVCPAEPAQRVRLILLSLAAIEAGARTELAPESASEMRRFLESHAQSDLGHGHVGFAQLLSCALQAYAEQVLVRAPAYNPLEQPAEMEGAKACNAGQGGQVEIFCKVNFDMVPRGLDCFYTPAAGCVPEARTDTALQHADNIDEQRAAEGVYFQPEPRAMLRSLPQQLLQVPPEVRCHRDGQPAEKRIARTFELLWKRAASRLGSVSERHKEGPVLWDALEVAATVSLPGVAEDHHAGVNHSVAARAANAPPVLKGEDEFMARKGLHRWITVLVVAVNERSDLNQRGAPNYPRRTRRTPPSRKSTFAFPELHHRLKRRMVIPAASARP
jgi:hypothetical protein